MNKIRAAILASGTIDRNNSVIVGVSGGPDSLCLLHALVELEDELNLTLYPIHINHKLRDNADKEMEHFIDICEEWGLDGVCAEVDCKAFAKEYKMSTEEAGRVIRFDIFNDCARQLEESGVPKESIRIAVAHNADDQSETVLQRIIRGTGIKGLAGMTPIRLDPDGFLVVRPILEVSRDEIEAYIKKNNLVPNMDESNESPQYTRNRIRLELIPYLEKNFNPNVKETIRTLADTAAIDDAFMNQVAYNVFDEAVDYDPDSDSLILDTVAAAKHHIAILRRLVSMILLQFGMDQDVGYQNIIDVVNLIYTDKPSASINLPDGVIARREYRKLIFSRGEPVKPDPTEGMRLVVQIMKRSSYNRVGRGLHAAFDYDKFCEKHPDKVSDISLRTRKRGDVIGIAGGKHKKLQDYLVDAKIPASYRDMIPLVAVDREVLWILPNEALPAERERNVGKFSQNYQITQDTVRVLFLEIVE